MDAVEDVPNALPRDLGLDTEVEKAIASNLERGYTSTVRVTTSLMGIQMQQSEVDPPAEASMNEMKHGQ